IKKLSKYREKFNLYLEKVSVSNKPEQKINVYNKILKIIKRLQFIETKGKVRVKPSLIKLEKFFIEGKKDIAEKSQQDKINPAA
ncbi:MAG TPA: hypothetical protein VLM39_07130, partial [Ignavibacteriaceae bacterium]|nr:hypothetical protein [Ignavibacteriaceae bacterium]